MPSNVDEMDELDGLIRRMLDQKAAAFTPTADDPRASIRRARRRLVRNGIAAALVVALASYGSVTAVGRLMRATPRPATTPTPIQGRLVARLIPGASGLAFENGSAWVSVSGQCQTTSTKTTAAPSECPSDSSPSHGAVLRIDRDTREILATIELPSDTVDIVGGFGAVWAADRVRPVIYRIDSGTNDVSTVTLPAPVQHLIVAAGSLWGSDGESRRVFRIDPVEARLAATIAIDGQALTDLMALGSRILANVEPPVDHLVEIDPSTDEQIDGLDAGHGEHGASVFSATEGAVWQAACIPDDLAEDASRPGPCAWQVMRLDPASGQILMSVTVGKWFPEDRLPASGRSTLAVSINSGTAGLWVLNHDLVSRAGGTLDRQGQLLLIDPAAHRVAATVSFEVSPSAGLYVFRLGEHDVWVAEGFGDILQPEDYSGLGRA
jgi:hypothetical protein